MSARLRPARGGAQFQAVFPALRVDRGGKREEEGDERRSARTESRHCLHRYGRGVGVASSGALESTHPRTTIDGAPHAPSPRIREDAMKFTIQFCVV